MNTYPLKHILFSGLALAVVVSSAAIRAGEKAVPSKPIPIDAKMLTVGTVAFCVGIGGYLYWKAKRREDRISQLRNLSEMWRWRQADKAIKEADNDQLGLLLEVGVGINRASTNEGSLLMIAAKHGNRRAVELLLKAGANVNQQGFAHLDQQRFTNMTALMEACLLAHDKVVELLLNKGADPNLRDGNGMVALRYALNPLKNYNRNNEIRVKIAKLLLDAGADSTARDYSNRTMLQVAASILGQSIPDLISNKTQKKAFKSNRRLVDNIIDARNGDLLDDERESFIRESFPIFGIDIGKCIVETSDSVWQKNIWPTCLECTRKHNIPQDLERLLLQFIVEPQR